MSRLDFSKLCKHRFKPFVVSTLGQSLDKDVQEAALATLTLFTSLMGEHFDFFLIEFEFLRLLNCG